MTVTVVAGFSIAGSSFLSMPFRVTWRPLIVYGLPGESASEFGPGCADPDDVATSTTDIAIASAVKTFAERRLWRMPTSMSCCARPAEQAAQSVARGTIRGYGIWPRTHCPIRATA